MLGRSHWNKTIWNRLFKAEINARESIIVKLTYDLSFSLFFVASQKDHINGLEQRKEKKTNLKRYLYTSMFIAVLFTGTCKIWKPISLFIRHEICVHTHIHIDIQYEYHSFLKKSNSVKFAAT